VVEHSVRAHSARYALVDSVWALCWCAASPVA